MGRFEEYVKYFTKYQEIYGDKTTVLYQCGMFFEVYGVDNDQEKIGHAPEIANLLNIQLTRTDKSKPENNRGNPLMTGFPCASLERNMQILIDHGYTAIVVEQTQTQTQTQTISRQVTGIYSPATTTFLNDTRTDNYLVSVFIQPYKGKRNKFLFDVGMAAIDLSTGKSFVHQAISSELDSFQSLDEIYRFTQTFQPSELLITENEQRCQEISDILERLDTIIHRPQFNEEMQSNGYHNHFLKDFFPDRGFLDPVQYLDFDLKASITTAYCIMLRFCQDHNPSLLLKLKKPVIWDNQKTLVLDNNAIVQLNLTAESRSTRGTGSVLQIITETSTNMGKRLLKERLLNPIIDTNLLNKRYDMIDQMLTEITVSEESLIRKSASKSNSEPIYQSVEKYLREIIDIERLHRKIETKTLQPTEFVQLISSYRVIIQLVNLLQSHKKFTELIPNDFQVRLNDYIDYCNAINCVEATKYNLNEINGNIFKLNYSSELDRLDKQISDNLELLDQIAKQLSSYSKSGATDHVIVKSSDDGYFLQTSKLRYKAIVKSFKPFAVGTVTVDLKSFIVDDRAKTTTKLRSSLIDNISDQLKSDLNELQRVTRIEYLNYLNNITEKYHKLLSELTFLTAELDFYKSAAKSAQKNNYKRPTLLHDTTTTESCFKVVNLRHPIIERLEHREAYKPHSFQLGQPEQKGILLYGINASGKSSIMKAAGIAVTMAQAGLFVPAEKLELTPYRSIMTRILGNDNIFKGLSSFAVEMSELRSIVSRATSRSLILGDEICHGTETYSAISIVAASIMHLSKICSSFIFATHLHQLSDMDEITSLSNVKQLHLTVHYDAAADQLIYDRQLKDGSGQTMYGIEVARAMKLPTEIIEKAIKIRNSYFEDREIKTSSYNKKMYYDKCQICDQPAVDVHHIKFQSEADSNGFIDSGHKNHLSNLVSLCKMHHDQVHNTKAGENQLIIHGYRSDGQLDYSYRKNLETFILRGAVKRIKINAKAKAQAVV